MPMEETKMELTELADEYLKQANKLLERIHRLNKRLPHLSGNDRLALKRRIMSLYVDAAECRKYAQHMKNYRKGEQNDEQNNL